MSKSSLPTYPITRRTTLAGLAGSAMLAALPMRLMAGETENPIFRHGVASGDPASDSVVLWTRVSASDEVSVEWELATDPAFTSLIQAGRTRTGAERDHTVKIVPQDLAPGQTYHFRFRANGVYSPVGRTRTLPTGSLDRLGIALASCSNYAFGYFNAYDAIARNPEVDFVLHTGDYIYEYGANEWGSAVAPRLGRVHQPAHEIVSLADYRTRHAQYKTDAGSQAMHAAHPMIACWDDHESANNPWLNGAQNHQPDTEGSWADRRAASIQAYYEWMPIREPEPGRTRADFWRSYSFGDLATMVTLETRHTGRGEQVDYMKHLPAIHSAEDAQAFERDVIGEPSRGMLSPAMETFFAENMAASRSSGQPWRLVGNAIPMARTRVPDVVALGIIPDPETETDLSLAALELAIKGKWNLPFYPDTWDGYPAARERFYAAARQAGASDLLVLTGDSHSFWANSLFDDQERPMGVEIGTAGITSPGDFLESGFGPETSRALDRVFAEHNSEVEWTDNFHQGYVLVVMDKEQARVDFVAVNTIEVSDYLAQVIRSERIVRNDHSIAFVPRG